MAPPRALRELTLTLGAAVVALGSLLYIAWKICFRRAGSDWDGWWERELRELREQAPPGDTVRREGLSRPVARRERQRVGISPGSPVLGFPSPHLTEPSRAGTGQRLGTAPGALRPPHDPAGEEAADRDCPRDHQLGKALDRQQDPPERVGLGKGAQGQDPPRTSHQDSLELVRLDSPGYSAG